MPEPPDWDLRTTTVTAVTHFALWLVPVVLVTWAGYPGVVCLTPLAWLLALRVGLLVMTSSTSIGRRRRCQEAALAGALLGLLQGLLLSGILLALLPTPAAQREQAFVLCAILTLAGLPGGAALSLLTAWLTAQRLAPR